MNRASRPLSTARDWLEIHERIAMEDAQMISVGKCPLTPALLQLLQESVNLGTTDATVIAKILVKSPATVRTEFQQVCVLLNVHTRLAAILIALRHKWIWLGPARRNPPTPVHPSSPNH